MKPKSAKSFSASIIAVVLVTALAAATGARATTVPNAQTRAVASISAGRGPTGFQTIAFNGSAEAGMLHRAYRILATGDHDYKGHRVKAMHAVEAAAKLLGLDLSGDLKDRSSQPLSDAKMREARGLINDVMGSAAVKDQKRVVKRLREAVNQIDAGLSVR